MVYFDNAATSFPKPRCVIKAVNDCIRNYCANSGRSAHVLADKTGEKIFTAREAIADFLSFPYPENVCFTTNATYALNIAIKTLVPKGSHVLISDMEHNSVIRPLEALKENAGVTYSSFSSDDDIESSIKESLRENTKTIVSTLASNVTGKSISLAILSSAARKYGLKLIVDASQAIGHKKIDLSKTPCDALCAPGHKGLFGIQGAGFIIFKEAPETTLIEGGSGNESTNRKMPKFLPEHIEAGTLPSPSVISIISGIKYINDIIPEFAEYKINKLTKILYERIINLKNCECFGGENGIVAFRIKNTENTIIEEHLRKNGFCVRNGLHCAPMMHEKLGTKNSGLIRISLSVFNNKNEIEKFYKTMLEIL